MTFVTALFLGIILITFYAVLQVLVAFCRVAIVLGVLKDFAKKYQAARAQQAATLINQLFGNLGASTRDAITRGIQQSASKGNFSGSN